MNTLEAFEKLKECSKNLSNVSYEEIYKLFTDGIKFIPLPIARIPKNVNIDRVRKNNGKVLFNTIDELGYIKDKNVIDKLTEFERANKPHQVMFYGALETSLINKPRLTAIAETSQLFKTPDINCLDGEYYTVSRWQTQDEFLVVEVVFSEYALQNNPDIVKSYEAQKKMLLEKNLSSEEIAFHLEFLKFISEEFAKKVSDPEDYKICVVYTNLIFLNPDVKGITYPSVQTEYFGVNIVLPPENVDKYLKPTTCSTQILYKNGKKHLIANGEHYCNLNGEKELNWKLKDKAVLISKEEAIKNIS